MITLNVKGNLVPLGGGSQWQAEHLHWVFSKHCVNMKDFVADKTNLEAA